MTNITITKTEAKSIMSLARKVQTAQEGTSSPTPSEKPAKKAPAKKKAPVSAQEPKVTGTDKRARNKALLRRCHGLIGHGSRESLEQALRELPDTTESGKKMRANAQAKLDALA